jgi:hypothetical protein
MVTILQPLQGRQTSTQCKNNPFILTYTTLCRRKETVHAAFLFPFPHSGMGFRSSVKSVETRIVRFF